MKKGYSVSWLALLVFAAFCLSALGVMLTGAGAYRRIVARGQDTFAERTLPNYIAARVRQAERVTVAPFGEGSALVLSDTLEGETYLTRVYCYEGKLMELYSPDWASLSPEDGEVILECSGFDVEIENGLLTAEVAGKTLYFSLKTQQEVLP